MFLFSIIIDLLYPRKCISCGNKSSYLCGECILKIKKENIKTNSFIYSIYSYKEEKIRKSLHLLKYKGVREIAKIFAIEIYDHLNNILEERPSLLSLEKIIIIPIPMSKKRKSERGQNHTETIAKELCKIDKEYLELRDNCLTKIKETRPQAMIKKKKTRLTNIIDSFFVKNKDQIFNKNIILIDDITTTGATLSEARKILLSNGARNVLAITIAH